jgi:ribose transport system permease protein
VAARVLVGNPGDPKDPGWWLPCVAILAAAGTGALCGLYNGMLVTALRLPPFIATLGTLGLFRGVSKWASDSSPVYARDGWLGAWVQPQPGVAGLLVAPVVWLTAGLALIAALLMHLTVFGRRAVAIGDNEESARRCAVPITRVKLGLYALCGLLVGIAGVVQFARLGGSGDPSIQGGLELRAIAAVVIGGAALSGGRASIMGTVCGTVLMALLDNRCTALGWPNYVQEIVVGHIIIIAVAVDRWKRP